MIDPQILEFWRYCLSCIEYGRTHPSIYTIPRMRHWQFDLKTMRVSMAHGGFGKSKLGYLTRKYPLDNLNEDGCIARIEGDHLHYRRVDPFRGLIGDLVYLKHLGFSSILISADDYTAKVHKIRASVVYPQVSNYFSDPIIVNSTFARAVLKELSYRMVRKYDNHSGTRINNDWFEYLNTPRRAQIAHDRLRDIVHAQ